MSKLCPVSEFVELSSTARLSYLLPLIAVCSHEELLTIQSNIAHLFYRDFVSHLPSDLSLLILTNLSLRDILSCMLVNTAWCNIIQYNTPLWKHQYKLLDPLRNIRLCDSQWKVFCRNAKLFQTRLYKPAEYCVNQFDISCEEMRIFELFCHTDYLLIHGLVGDSISLYRDVLLVWKWEENGFKFKLDILETVDIGGYQFPIRYKSVSIIRRIIVSSNYLFVLHLYLVVFDLRTLSLVCQLSLPSMSEVVALDFTENSDNSLNLIAVAFFDHSVHIMEPTGVSIHKFVIDEDIFFHIFSLFNNPTPSILIHSRIWTKRYNIHGQSLTIDSLRSCYTKSNSSVVSKDKERVAILEWKDATTQSMLDLFVFTTNSWKLVYHNKIHSFNNFYFILDVGRRYVVLLNTIAKLELVIYDIQLVQPPSIVVFDNIQPYREIFSTHHVLALSVNGWLDGKVFDTFGEEANNVPLFLVVTRSTPFPLHILSLTI